MLLPTVKHIQPRPRPAQRGRGFSLTELLVVIGIIVLLIGLLLVALGGVREKARRTDTESIMQAFAQACETFQMDHGFYPGVLPEVVLGANQDKLTSTENALFHLMGGARTVTSQDPPNGQVQAEYDAFKSAANNPIEYTNLTGPGLGYNIDLVIDLNRMGEGPVINGQPHPAYFTVSGREFGIVAGQVGAAGGFGSGAGETAALPDLVDAWGQPIIYVRRLRSVGPLVGPVTGGGAPPQFTRAGIGGYVNSTKLGEKGLDQTALSLLKLGSDEDKDAILAQLLRHPGFGPGDPHEHGGGVRLDLQSRGGFMLLSAGPDGVYYSVEDGPGSPDEPIEDADTFLNDYPPSVLDEFDDVRIFGGS